MLLVLSSQVCQNLDKQSFKKDTYGSCPGQWNDVSFIDIIKDGLRDLNLISYMAVCEMLFSFPQGLGCMKRRVSKDKDVLQLQEA